MRILYVEDDRSLVDYTRKRLEEEGYTVTACYDGSAGLRAAELNVYDLILMDVMLPVLSGIEAIKRLRLQSVRTPVLILTARDAPQDIVAGLDAGADDYLTKPFTFEVLLAHIRARIRASESNRSASTLRFSDLVLETEKHEARRGTRLLNLTRTEYAILECLMRCAGRVVTRSRLIERVWEDRPISDSTLDAFMRFLREKVELPGRKKLIYTERGIGYRLKDY
jgi:two-component system response regulator MprA